MSTDAPMSREALTARLQAAAEVVAEAVKAHEAAQVAFRKARKDLQRAEAVSKERDNEMTNAYYARKRAIAAQDAVAEELRAHLQAEAETAFRDIVDNVHRDIVGDVYRDIVDNV